MEKVTTLAASTRPLLTAAALEIGIALLLYSVGYWLIGLAISILDAALTWRNFDTTLQRCVANIVAVVRNVMLVIGVLGCFRPRNDLVRRSARWHRACCRRGMVGPARQFRSRDISDHLPPVQGRRLRHDRRRDRHRRGSETVLHDHHPPDNLETIVGNGKVSSEVMTNFTIHKYRQVERTAPSSRSGRSATMTITGRSIPTPTAR